MIRIHAGRFKGVNINRVNVFTTKETASMVREAVFNVLYEVDGNVLDLFAGSGSYGITALSLGAEKATFVDNNTLAVKTINENLKKVKAFALVIKTDYESFLDNTNEMFDLVFLDPPYDFINYENLLSKLSLNLNENAKVILEVSKKTLVNIKDVHLNLIRDKNYGSKKILIFTKE